MTPLATLSAMEARLRRPLTGPEATAAEAAIDDATALVLAVTGRTWLVSGVPDTRVTPIVLSVALRAFRNPEGYSTETVGSWTGVTGGSGQDVASGVYLTTHERDQLRALMGKSGIVSVEVTRPEHTATSGVVYVAVDYGGEPFPLLTEGWA